MAKIIRWNMKHLSDAVKKRIENNFDCVICIDGVTGESRRISKSTCAVLLGIRIKGRNFGFKKDIVYTRKQVMDQLARKKYDVIIGDEMINAGYKRDWYDSAQKDLIKMLNMYGDNYNVFIWCIPSFLNLDPNLRELVKIRINVVARGIAIVHLPVQSSYKIDPWDIENNKKIEAKWKGKPKYAQLTTFSGILTYGDLKPNQKKQYLEVKDEMRNRMHLDGNNIEIKDNVDRLTERIEKGEISRKTLQEIALISGIDYKSLRTQVRDRLKKKGINKKLKDMIGKGKHIINGDKTTDNFHI